MSRISRISKILLVSVLSVLLFGAWLPVVQAAAPPSSFAPLVKTLTPAVVNINTTKVVARRGQNFNFHGSPFSNDQFDEFFNRFFGHQHQRKFKQRSLGSGFIINKDGYILTNNHVVEDADEVKVTLSDEKTYDAKVIGTDAKTDLAVLKIDVDHDLPVASLGDSSKLEVGDWVVAIGNPFGLARTVTAGIVSARGRVIGSGPYDDFIQTDASINPGNSGGPLFNLQGEVVGINAAIVASGQGIGFAIPVNMAKDLLPQLKTGKVSRGWLGVQIQKVTPELAESFNLDSEKGALVADVVEDSPAARAGVKTGDIILSFNGHEVDSMRELPRIVAAVSPGTKVKMKVLRLGRVKKLTVVIAELKDGGNANSSSSNEGDLDSLGMVVRQITPELAGQHRLPRDFGVVISRIDPDGLAAEGGLHAGDIILQVNNSDIETVKDFRQAVKKAKKNKLVRFLVQRRNSRIFVVMRIN
ncbi:MAG: DegQ family serine endoprotease [Pseudomonadota bacterium]|nr:DegQ family serine endoprotease [Pseudomonadota bacterium]